MFYSLNSLNDIMGVFSLYSVEETYFGQCFLLEYNETFTSTSSVNSGSETIYKIHHQINKPQWYIKGHSVYRHFCWQNNYTLIVLKT